MVPLSSTIVTQQTFEATHADASILLQIFGATGHIGRSIVKAALAHNDLVTAVGQSFEDTLPGMATALYPPALLPPPSAPTTSVPRSASDTLATRSPYLGLLCDVRVRETVSEVFEKSLSHWGRYDTVANCTGYGVIGACEDQDEYEIRNQFEVNFWGTLNILQLSVPYFRQKAEGKRRAVSMAGGGTGSMEDDDEDDEGGIGGRYLIFSSTSGALGVPGLGPYCATKYAVEGLVESMLYETAAFDIRATLVEPGHVRRDDPPPAAYTTNGAAAHDATASPDMKMEDDQVKRSCIAGTGAAGADLPTFGHFKILPMVPGSAYNSPTSPAQHAKRIVQWLGERQPTSAVKSAELVWQLGHCRFPPLRLLLGAFAVESVRERMKSVTEEIEDWRNLSFERGDAEGGDGGSAAGQARDDEGEDDEGEDRDVKMEDDADGGRKSEG